ncbi:hypothetical protein KUCAC02_010583, partial [Chaenocephalus aceratus]
TPVGRAGFSFSGKTQDEGSEMGKRRRLQRSHDDRDLRHEQGDCYCLSPVTEKELNTLRPPEMLKHLSDGLMVCICACV